MKKVFLLLLLTGCAHTEGKTYYVSDDPPMADAYENTPETTYGDVKNDQPSKVINVVGFEDDENTEDGHKFNVELTKCLTTSASTDPKVDVSGFLARINTVMTCADTPRPPLSLSLLYIQCSAKIGDAVYVNKLGGYVRGDYVFFEKDNIDFTDPGGGQHLNTLLVLDSKTKEAILVERLFLTKDSAVANTSVCKGVYLETK